MGESTRATFKPKSRKETDNVMAKNKKIRQNDSAIKQNIEKVKLSNK